MTFLTRIGTPLPAAIHCLAGSCQTRSRQPPEFLALAAPFGGHKLANSLCDGLACGLPAQGRKAH